MPACQFGSEPKAGQPAYFYVNEDTIRAVLPDALDWLAPFIPAASTVLWETAEFCATVPPDPEDFGISDLPTSLRDVLSITALVDKVVQWATARIWYERCQCIAGPTAPVCAGPNVHTDSMASNGPADFVCWAVDSTVQTATVRLQSTASQTFPTLAYTVKWFDVNNVQISQVAAGNMGQNDDFTLGPFARPSNATGFCVNWSRNAASPYNASLTFTATFTCSNPGTPFVDPGQPDQPTGWPDAPTIACETTEDLCTQIAALRDRLSITDAMVTLIQRQSVPFAYVPGTIHAGLSGAGSFAVQGILALSVNITTLPSAYGSIQANPPVLWDVGWITLGTADGDLHAVRIAHDPLLIAPISGMITVVKYFLKPGVVATISELLREP